MTENPETVRLIMSAIERIDGKLEALDQKFERKMGIFEQKLDVNLREMQNEILELQRSYSTLSAKCKSCLYEDQEKKIDELQRRLTEIHTKVANNEWTQFFRQLGKVAAYIVAIGTAIVLLQQIFGIGPAVGKFINGSPAPVAAPNTPSP